MRILSFLVLIVFFSSKLVGQIATGDWRMHVAPKGIDVAVGEGVVYAAYETGLLEYDIESKETSIWTDVNALSDIQISCVYFDEKSKSLFVGYKNGNIDRIKNNAVTNIPAIKLAQIQGNKSVTHFIENQGFIYASTGFGIVVINPENNEIKDSYYPTNSLEQIQSLAFKGDSIYALTPSRLYACNLSNPALADPNQWKLVSRVPIIANDTYQNIENIENELYFIKKFPGLGYDSLFHLTDTDFEVHMDFGFNIEIQNFRSQGGAVFVTTPYSVLYLKNNFELEYQLYIIAQGEPVPTSLMNSVIYDFKVFSVDNNYGLYQFRGEGAINIKFAGPPKNKFFALGGNKEVITVAGGIIAKTGYEFSDAGAYIFRDEEWTLLDRYNQELWINTLQWDISSVAVHPQNSDQFAVGAFSHMPLSLSSNGKTIDEVYTSDNSMLEAYAMNGVCISDLKYDSKGNLWLSNCFSNKPLKMLDKDKVWHEFETNGNSKSRFTGKLVIDQSDNKWFAVYDQGIFGYNDNGTIDDLSDDKTIQINSGDNTGALPTTNVTALAVDLENRLWIGTSNGFAILYNPDNAFEGIPGEYNAQRIKIDFEGNVEYLLGNTSITDIEIDGGNRKWIGTANAGIFLLSADGSEVIESYTSENSPLISNNIVDMQFNYKTGELFIITDIGLVSLRTNSSLGDDKYENVVVFPNPVKPGFDGVITLQGIKYDSDVKVTDAAGNLVFQTTSNGGTVTWNGKNLKGEKVSAGTYLFWTASNTEKGRKVAKVLILN
jgi:hypothetical protein